MAETTILEGSQFPTFIVRGNHEICGLDQEKNAFRKISPIYGTASVKNKGKIIGISLHF